MFYRIEWTIELDADTAREAAEKAFEIMQRPGTTANYFTVAPEIGEPVNVDLSEPPDPEPIGDAAKRVVADLWDFI